MIIKKLFTILILTATLSSCANYSVDNSTYKKNIEKQFYTSTGFALIYEESLYTQKIVKKKMKVDDIDVMHNSLKRNTKIKIINPDNLKVIETKVSKRSDYPKIFNIVISEKVASILDLDIKNPYVEIIEIKKNKTFIAKKTNTHNEEKNVAGKAPVKKIKMNDLSKVQEKKEKEVVKKKNYILVINDFYYVDSANNLKDELVKKIKMSNIYVKKINDNKYRLLAGPFKNFNALKSSYISLNNLGFEDLNIYRE